MKKIRVIIQPFLSIIFGALILLTYLNLLQGTGEALALGITATILATYYLTIGVLEIVLGNKLNELTRKIFNILSISLFASFVFVSCLLTIINAAEAFGPTGWIIILIQLISSISLSVIFIIASFANSSVLKRITLLVACIFSLGLLLNVLFDVTGVPEVLGNLVLVLLALYAAYCSMLFAAILGLKAEEKQPVKQETEED